MSEASLDTIRQAVAQHLQVLGEAEAQIFLNRFDRLAASIYQQLKEVYAYRDGIEPHLEAIFLTAAQSYIERPQDLKVLDNRREDNPTWFQTHRMMGAFCYVDRFAGDLQGIRDKIGYFKELGLTYLHLMPLFATPDGPNDGGYAVSSYREVDPALGTMDDLKQLAADLRAAGISLVLDFVFNHTANDHDWAQRAVAGEAPYRDYYYFFPDRTLPEQYERTLREIFPDEDPGQFTYVPQADSWVWTTFHTYQWDLNYRNPAVFRQMLEEMLFLANIGAEGIRLDAVAFIWKEMGTSCENLPQAHSLISAFNSLARLAAPGVIFKSEAIVHPDDVVKYFGGADVDHKEAEIGYNPLLMVELWEAMATGYTHLLNHSMKHRFDTIPHNAAWVNYVRSHDDIGWGFADEDAQALGIGGFHHRQYLNRFYTGEEENSWAVGFPFQYNPENQDMRISGTTASLNGLEKAIQSEDNTAIEHAIRRILLMYSVVLSMGGIPLLNLGDEIAMLNDYAYKDDPTKAGDSRWAHRPIFDWQRAEHRHNPEHIVGRVFLPLKKMIAIREATPAFAADSQTHFIDGGSRALYIYRKTKGQSEIVCLTNFRAAVQPFAVASLEVDTPTDLLTGEAITVETLTLRPYGVMWLTPSR